MSKKQHLSRLATPRTWPIKRKASKWIAKPDAGSHNIATSVPLVVMVRDILSIVETSKDVKKMLNSKDLLVNKMTPKSIKLPVGFLDVISIPKMKKDYRIIYTKNGKLKAEEIKQTEAETLPLRIRSKNNIKGGKTQLNFSNGWNLLVSKDTYKVNDVVVLDLKSRKIINHIKFGPGKDVYVIAGRRLGSLGKLKEIKKIGLLKKDNIATLESGGDTWETKAEYLFIKE